MRYDTANAFRTALEQRLKNEAEASGIALMRLRKRVAFERFLARLATSESSGWVLKGAFALELRLGLRARTTKDIDLGDFSSSRFDARRHSTPPPDSTPFATRFALTSMAAGSSSSSRCRVQRSVADPGGTAFRRELAGVRRRRSAAAAVSSLEQHVAEKLHAYTGAFGRDQRESTRVKDLVDLVLIGELVEIDAKRLHQALTITFAQRGRQPLPNAIHSQPRERAPRTVLPTTTVANRGRH